MSATSGRQPHETQDMSPPESLLHTDNSASNPLASPLLPAYTDRYLLGKLPLPVYPSSLDAGSNTNLRLREHRTPIAILRASKWLTHVRKRFPNFALTETRPGKNKKKMRFPRAGEMTPGARDSDTLAGIWTFSIQRGPTPSAEPSDADNEPRRATKTAVP